jgi:hypothetical protein
MVQIREATMHVRRQSETTYESLHASPIQSIFRYGRESRNFVLVDGFLEMICANEAVAVKELRGKKVGVRRVGHRFS